MPPRLSLFAISHSFSFWFLQLCDHTWRVVFCLWASQLGGNLYEVIETGGWKWDSSAEWVKYFHEGLQLYHGYTDQGEVDPLSEILP